MTSAFRSLDRCGDCRAVRGAVSAVEPHRVTHRPVPESYPLPLPRQKTGAGLPPRRCLRAGHHHGRAAAGAARWNLAVHSRRPWEWGQHVLLQACGVGSIDHIHPGAVRRRAGRPPTGRLALSR